LRDEVAGGRTEKYVKEKIGEEEGWEGVQYIPMKKEVR